MSPTLFFFALLNFHQIWFAIPLVVAYSLVYCATRHESPQAIIDHAIRFALWLVLFIAVVYGILYLVV